MNNTYKSKDGWVAVERHGGIDIYDNGIYICAIEGVNLEAFTDENGEIDDDAIDREVHNALSDEV